VICIQVTRIVGLYIIVDDSAKTSAPTWYTFECLTADSTRNPQVRPSSAVPTTEVEDRRSKASKVQPKIPQFEEGSDA